MDSALPTAKPPCHPSFWEAFRYWLLLGFVSFGGPAGQIAIMHRELVERRKWISESRFLHALAYCNLLPGPEAQQLAIYCGWLLHRTAGGIVAGILFVLPSVFILWALSYVYVVHGAVPSVAAIFYGLSAAVLAVVAAAVIRIGRRTLKNAVMWGIAALAFVSIYFLRIPFPAIIAAAGLAGLIGQRIAPDKFRISGGHGAGAPEAAGAHLGSRIRPSLSRALKVCAVCIPLWLAPVALAGLLAGWDSTLVKEGVFFSIAAMVTFGGAYAVLPFVAQNAVEHFGWLTSAQMTAGLGLAETTPGPLIMVVQFVGFLGGWNQPGGMPPLLAATLGALMATWVTFLPCFLWIFLGAPHVEGLRDRPRASAALAGITAAVVGVVLNLAVWFGGRILIPASGGVDWFAAAVAVFLFAGMVRFKWALVPVILGAGMLGLVWRLLLAPHA